MSILDNEGHNPLGFGNTPRPTDELRAARAEIEVLRPYVDAFRREEDRADKAGRRIDDLEAALAPFMKFYDDIRFNLRKQPRPTDTAIQERGERVACVTWAEFHALRDALAHGQST